MTTPSFVHSDVDIDLRNAVRSMLSAHGPWSEVLARTDSEPSFGAEVWSRLRVDLGCVGLPIPEDLGGGGASWAEAAVVMEELGRFVSDTPFFTSAVLATALLEGANASELLESMASGEVTATVAFTFGRTPLDLVASDVVVDGRFVNGTVDLVAGAREADVVLVVTDNSVVATESRHVHITPSVSLDMTRQLSDLRFDRAPCTVLLTGDAVAGAGRRAADIAAAMLASEQLGLAERCLDLTVDYLNTRRQFGRKLGSYQALKHRVADVWTGVVQARAVSRYAAICAATGDDLPIAASMAQAVCSSVAVRAAEECIQMHGGIGFTWEHPAHLFLKRARADAVALGTPAWHRRRLGRLIDLPAPVLAG